MDARRGLFEDFAIATAVLTRLPVGAATPGGGAIAAAGWAFPLVGAGVGALVALAFLFAQLLGCGIPVAALIALLGAFIAYQLYRLYYHLTIGLTLLTIFDAFVVWLTWREYQAKRNRALLQ